MVAFAAALVGVVVTSPIVRRLGREEVYVGGAADAAFGPGPGATAPVRRVDAEELGEMATIEFEPPRDLSATAGGIVLRERVETRHKIAWLLECAIREEVELVGEGDDLRLRPRLPAAPSDRGADARRAVLADATQIELGTYDTEFAQGWNQLDHSLDEWWEHSDLWHPEGHSRRDRGHRTRPVRGARRRSRPRRRGLPRTRATAPSGWPPSDWARCSPARD